MLRFLSRATLGSKGEVFDAGTDLSNSFVSELVCWWSLVSVCTLCCLVSLKTLVPPNCGFHYRYCKDVIIFISILQFLSAISLKLWFLWVIVSHTTLATLSNIQSYGTSCRFSFLGRVNASHHQHLNHLLHCYYLSPFKTITTLLLPSTPLAKFHIVLPLQEGLNKTLLRIHCVGSIIGL